MLFLCIYALNIWNSLKLIFTEPNITLLNLISRFFVVFCFKKVLTYECWSCHDHKPCSSPEFWLFGECPFLANEFFVSKVNCGGNTFLSTKKRVVRFHCLKKINNVFVKNFAVVNLIWLATFWNQKNPLAWLLLARIYRPGFMSCYIFK